MTFSSQNASSKSLYKRLTCLYLPSISPASTCSLTGAFMRLKMIYRERSLMLKDDRGVWAARWLFYCSELVYNKHSSANWFVTHDKTFRRSLYHISILPEFQMSVLSSLTHLALLETGESKLGSHSVGSVGSGASVQYRWSWELKALIKGPQTCDYSARAGARTNDLPITSTEA